MKSQIGQWGNSLALRIPKYAVEALDLKTDTSSNSVIFSAATVQNLVGAGNSSTLTLRLGSEDSFTIDNSEALYTQGQSIKFYSDAAHTTQIAQVNFTYV